MRNSPLIKLPFKYGLISSLFVIVLLMILYVGDKHPLLIPIIFDIRIFIFLLFIFFAIKDYRDNHGGGYLHLWQGLIIGTTLYVTVGFVVSFFLYVYIKLDPGFLNEYIAGAEQGMLDQKEVMVNGPQKVKMTIEEFNFQLESLKSTSAGQIAVDYFFKTLFLGVFIPLVYSIIFRKVESN